ncbi:hypothetical protein [Pedobacter sp. R-06]|uniref:hypothetical protein n=1 Tax=Pedobacter sp. R-06 TaxID=3404051 RepID=UPI003CE7021A
MAKFITVLTSHVNDPQWTAVQTAGSLSALLANRYFTAGINSTIFKSPGDTFIQDVTVTETDTQLDNPAKIYELSAQTAQLMSLFASKPSKKLIKLLEKKGGHHGKQH